MTPRPAAPPPPAAGPASSPHRRASAAAHAPRPARPATPGERPRAGFNVGVLLLASGVTWVVLIAAWMGIAAAGAAWGLW